MDYKELNKQSWNKRTEMHVDSEFYDIKGFLKGKSSLKQTELDLLGDIKGKKILHLQCHFGQDTISLGRLGADVTGVDLSDVSIGYARELSEKTGIAATFICCDIYELPDLLDQKFDMVFTSYGTIIWLPDLFKWANIISGFLKPNGNLIFVEFHPLLWIFDENYEKVIYNYFNKGPLVETSSQTYTDPDKYLELNDVLWNHSLGEVINNLIRNDLEITFFEEYNFSPYNCFNNKTIEYEPGKFRIKHLEDKIPMLFAIKATKKDNPE